MADAAKVQLLRELENLQDLLALRLERASFASSASDSFEAPVATPGQELFNVKPPAASLGVTLLPEKKLPNSNMLPGETPALMPLAGQSKPGLVPPGLAPVGGQSKPELVAPVLTPLAGVTPPPCALTPGHNNRGPIPRVPAAGLTCVGGHKPDHLMSTEPPVATLRVEDVVVQTSKPPFKSLPPIPEEWQDATTGAASSAVSTSKAAVSLELICLHACMYTINMYY